MGLYSADWIACHAVSLILSLLACPPADNISLLSDPLPAHASLSHPGYRHLALDHALLAASEQTDPPTNLFDQATQGTSPYCCDLLDRLLCRSGGLCGMHCSAAHLLGHVQAQVGPARRIALSYQDSPYDPITDHFLLDEPPLRKISRATSFSFFTDSPPEAFTILSALFLHKNPAVSFLKITFLDEERALLRRTSSFLPVTMSWYWIARMNHDDICLSAYKTTLPPRLAAYKPTLPSRRAMYLSRVWDLARHCTTYFPMHQSHRHHPLRGDRGCCRCRRMRSCTELSARVRDNGSAESRDMFAARVDRLPCRAVARCNRMMELMTNWIEVIEVFAL